MTDERTSDTDDGPATLRERIRAADDRRTKIVEVPEWDDVKVEVRSMTGLQRARYLKSAYDPDTGEPDFEAIYPQLLVTCVFDPDTGEQLFGPKDAEWLNEKNSAALERVATVCLELAGLGEEGTADKTGRKFPAGVE